MVLVFEATRLGQLALGRYERSRLLFYWCCGEATEIPTASMFYTVYTTLTLNRKPCSHHSKGAVQLVRKLGALGFGVL